MLVRWIRDSRAGLRIRSSQEILSLPLRREEKESKNLLMMWNNVMVMYFRNFWDVVCNDLSKICSSNRLRRLYFLSERDSLQLLRAIQISTQRQSTQWRRSLKIQSLPWIRQHHRPLFVSPIRKVFFLILNIRPHSKHSISLLRSHTRMLTRAQEHLSTHACRRSGTCIWWDHILSLLHTYSSAE